MNVSQPVVDAVQHVVKMLGLEDKVALSDVDVLCVEAHMLTASGCVFFSYFMPK